jgi:predicted dehydrogenase
MTPIRIGIIGAGSYGEAHAHALKDHDDLQLVAASRNDAQALQTFCEAFNCRGYTDNARLLADPDVDVVVIATPHHLHTGLLKAAAAAGKHILLEKPMAPSLPECHEIIASVQQAGVKFMVGHVNHFARAYQTARQIIDSGELGEVVMGVSTMSKFWYEPNRRWWHLQRTTGGGMWLTAGIHCLDRLTWLVGAPVTSTSASLGARFHDQEADDAGMVFLRYANGAAGTIVSVGYADGAPKHLTELTCTRGTMNIDYVNGVSIGRGEKWQSVPDSGAADWMHGALVEEWQQFKTYLRTDGSPSPVSGEYAFHIMSVIFAAEDSSARGVEVPVPLEYTYA